MKIDLLISVHGASNSGKSTILRSLIDDMNGEIEKEFNLGVSVEYREDRSSNETVTVRPQNVDFVAVFTIDNRIKLGIATGGDNGRIEEQNWKFLTSSNCNIIVVAGRTKGATVEKIEKYAQDAQLFIPLFKARCKKEEDRNGQDVKFKLVLINLLKKELTDLLK